MYNVIKQIRHGRITDRHHTNYRQSVIEKKILRTFKFRATALIYAASRNWDCYISPVNPRALNSDQYLTPLAGVTGPDISCNMGHAVHEEKLSETIQAASHYLWMLGEAS